MKFYHGTSLEAWEAIQKDGQLWGERGTPSRCTYLADDALTAAKFGEVLLEVEYTPGGVDKIGQVDNYFPDCWQLRVYCPIPLSCIRRINQ